MTITSLFGRTTVMRKMRNPHYDIDDALYHWDLPAFAHVCDLGKVVYLAPVRIVEVIHICIRYYLLSFIMHTWREVIAVLMSDHRFKVRSQAHDSTQDKNLGRI
jgi:hypothetical protein